MKQPIDFLPVFVEKDFLRVIKFCASIVIVVNVTMAVFVRTKDKSCVTG